MARGRGKDEAGLRKDGPLLWTSYDGDYDHETELHKSLEFPLTPGAKEREVLELEHLKDLIQEDDIVIISDVHSQRDRLRETLTRLGLLDEKAQRIRPEVTLVQIGDLIDGRDPLDIQTLEDGRDWFDKIICGNHEAAYINGPDFMGWQPNPTLTQQLKRLFWEDKLVGAMDAHGHLITHAGASPSYWYTELGTEQIAQAIDEQFKEWNQMLVPGRSYPGLFAMDARRGDNAGQPGGGVMWVDWAELIQDLDPEYKGSAQTHDQNLKQIVGHTPRGHMEQALDESMVNIDVAGARLGVAVVKPDGQLYTGSDRIF